MTLPYSHVIETLGMQRVGAGPVFSWVPHAASEFRYYLTTLGPHLVAWHASVANPAEACANFLASVSTDDLGLVNPERPAAFSRRAVPDFPQHEGFAVVHPAAARYAFNKATQGMTENTYLCFPCRRCELTDDDSVAEVRTRLGARLLAHSRPERPVFPAVSMRFEHRHPKTTKSSGGAKLGVFAIGEVTKHVVSLPSAGGFVELENWERRRARLSVDGGRVTLKEGRGKAIELFEDELTPWLEAFTTKSADDAMKVIKR
jgi:hypothetical protein